MVETPQTVIDRDGTAGVRKFVDAGQGRVRGAHFGTYDYTASLTITAAHQTMTHPACDFARHALQVSLAGTGVWLSDGATNVMPVPLHRGDELTPVQVEENRQTVHDAMRLHYDHIRHSLTHAYYQGWDLHPAQFPTRYAAVYAFFLEGLDQAGERLSNFVESAAKATLVGEVFDDAATGQGLLNFFLRAINCGAIDETEATTRTGLTLDEIQTRSFLAILEGRTAGAESRSGAPEWVASAGDGEPDVAVGLGNGLEDDALVLHPEPCQVEPQMMLVGEAELDLLDLGNRPQ